jgi:hypothetical protein
MSDEGRARDGQTADAVMRAAEEEWLGHSIDDAVIAEPYVRRIAAALAQARAEGEAAEGNPLAVERFDLGHYGDMESCPEGEWVRWSAVWRSLARLASLDRDAPGQPEGER